MTFSFTSLLMAAASATGFSGAIPAVQDIVSVVTTVEQTYPTMTGAQKLAAAKQLLNDAAALNPALAPLVAEEPAVEAAINGVVSALNALKGFVHIGQPATPPAPDPNVALPIQAFSGNVAATTAYNTVKAQGGTDLAATQAAQAVKAAGGK